MMPNRVLARAVLVLLCLSSAALARAQAYTQIVVFGDSLSDTGNDTAVSNAKYGPGAAVPSPSTGYTTGRFTDGTDTLPAAKNYFGVWLEQLAASLPAKPTIVNSLAGGKNYAYGFATTNTGQTNFTYGPGNALSFQVNNMGAQVSAYLATNPTIDNKTLFVVWGGANDLINATSSQDIVTAAQREAGIVQALISAGATDFIVPNLPPLGLVPRFNGMAATSAAATQAAAGFDQALAAYLGAIPAANPGKTLHIYQLDTYTLFNTIVAAPASRGFTNVTASSSAALTGNTTVNPDTYLFWDDLHPTTRGHNQLALAAMTLIGTPIATTTVLTSSNLNANQNASVTFTATVTSMNGIPTGAVTFSDGSTVLTTATVTGATPTATYSTSALTPGPHAITATFTGVNGYMGSTSSVTEVVVAPSLNSSFASTTLNIQSGGSGTIVLTLNPVGGIAGTATFVCGALPAHFSCSFSPASATLPGTNAPVTTTLTIGTNAVASLDILRPAGPNERLFLGFAFPAFGLLGFGAMRRRKTSLRGAFMTSMLLAACGAAVLGLSGCGSSNTVKKGAYPITAIATANGVSATATLQVNVQ